MRADIVSLLCRTRPLLFGCSSIPRIRLSSSRFKTAASVPAIMSVFQSVKSRKREMESILLHSIHLFSLFILISDYFQAKTLHPSPSSFLHISFTFSPLGPRKNLENLKVHYGLRKLGTLKSLSDFYRLRPFS